MGRHLAALPLLSHSVLAAQLLLQETTPSADWQPLLTEGTQRVALAIDESQHHMPAVLRTRASRQGDGWQLDGEKIDLLPMGADEIARCKPIYESIPGWTDSTVGVTEYDKLPVNARRYLDRIAEVTGVPIAMVSTSPDRDHTILMHNPYSAA